MKYFNEENFKKCCYWLKGIEPSIENLAALRMYMSDNQIYPDYTDVSKVTLTLIARIHDTQLDTPNWAVTLPDGSQLLWNRVSGAFFEVGGSRNLSMRTSWFNRNEIFSVEITPDLEYLISKFGNWRFCMLQKELLDIYNGRYNEFNNIRFCVSEFSDILDD